MHTQVVNAGRLHIAVVGAEFEYNLSHSNAQFPNALWDSESLGVVRCVDIIREAGDWEHRGPGIAKEIKPEKRTAKGGRWYSSEVIPFFDGKVAKIAFDRQR